jgi:hypothetical protein
VNADLICELGRLRRPPSGQMEFDPFESRMTIITGLIEMRKAGIVRMVYCDDNRLAIVLPSENDIPGSIRQSISWIQALQMVEEFRRQSAAIQPTNVERKPPRSELPKEVKKWAK